MSNQSVDLPVPLRQRTKRGSRNIFLQGAKNIRRQNKQWINRNAEVVDALCYTPEEFERKKQEIGVVREAVEKGIRLV
ncbi:MAG: hypothetical protein QME42_09245 [bacterium]|nr:hypothetical protein [bacterium]